jgi:heterodisulfide reductase subunit A
MDMRMFGVGCEELYHEAQTKYNVQFIRVRLSEASPAEKNLIQCKAEDTLLGRPVKVTRDMLVLMVGMTTSNQVVFEETAVQNKEPEVVTPLIMPNEVFV